MSVVTVKSLFRLAGLQATGFVSANIHESDDGVRVTKYAQWRSHEDYAAMLKNPEAKAHMQPIMDIATFY